MRVRRVLMPNGAESWTVLDADVDPVPAVEGSWRIAQRWLSPGLGVRPLPPVGRGALAFLAEVGVRPPDRGQVVEHRGETGTHHVAGQQVVIGGPPPQRIDLLRQVLDMQGLQRVFADRDPVVGDAQGLRRGGEERRELGVVVEPGLGVVGPGPRVGQVRGAVDRADTAGLALNAHPSTNLVLMGDDHDVVGHRGFPFQQGAQPDQLRAGAVAVPDREDIPRRCGKSVHETSFPSWFLTRPQRRSRWRSTPWRMFVTVTISYDVAFFGVGACLRGGARPWATSDSCCCHPCSHFHAAVNALVDTAIMKATIWVWSKLAPGTRCATTPAIQPAAIAKTGVSSATPRPNNDPSATGADVVAGGFDSTAMFPPPDKLRAIPAMTAPRRRPWPEGPDSTGLAALETHHPSVSIPFQATCRFFRGVARPVLSACGC